MAAVHDYPLIALTEVLDLPSVDNKIGDYYSTVLGKTEDILERKLDDVMTTSDCSCGSCGYNWPRDIEFNDPIHILTYDGPETDVYGHSLDDSWHGRKIMGNGHHRLAFQIMVQGALFVPYTEDMNSSGW